MWVRLWFYCKYISDIQSSLSVWEGLTFAIFHLSGCSLLREWPQWGGVDWMSWWSGAGLLWRILIPLKGASLHLHHYRHIPLLFPIFLSSFWLSWCLSAFCSSVIHTSAFLCFSSLGCWDRVTPFLSSVCTIHHVNWNGLTEIKQKQPKVTLLHRPSATWTYMIADGLCPLCFSWSGFVRKLFKFRSEEVKRGGIGLYLQPVTESGGLANSNKKNQYPICCVALMDL